MKDFDSWNTLKKRIHDSERRLYVKEREIWWCNLGLNIGTEIDGKNKIFERPVLVLKGLSAESAFILPLTTKHSTGKDHVLLVTYKM
jgi:mRNA interferase MazF